jgi:hypothetical protein
VGVFVVLLAWCLMSVPAGLLVGRLLSFSSRHEVDFVRAARDAMLTGRLSRTAS